MPRPLLPPTLDLHGERLPAIACKEGEARGGLAEGGHAEVPPPSRRPIRTAPASDATAVGTAPRPRPRPRTWPPGPRTGRG
eukprot:173927-Alexandrium_andersonii.AAC.1